MWEYFVYCYGTQFLMLVLCAIAGTLGFGLKALVRKHLDSADKIAVAKVAMGFVEQVWKEIHGPEKLQKALEVAQEMLAKKGIDFDAEEMTVLIEAAVAEFNAAFKKPTDAEDTAKAVYRADEPSDAAYAAAVEAGVM